MTNRLDLRGRKTLTYRIRKGRKERWDEQRKGAVKKGVGRREIEEKEVKEKLTVLNQLYRVSLSNAICSLKVLEPRPY